MKKKEQTPIPFGIHFMNGYAIVKLNCLLTLHQRARLMKLYPSMEIHPTSEGLTRVQGVITKHVFNTGFVFDYKKIILKSQIQIRENMIAEIESAQFELKL